MRALLRATAVRVVFLTELQCFVIFLEPLANFTQIKETKTSWHFAIGEVQKDVNVMDLVKSLPTSNTE